MSLLERKTIDKIEILELKFAEIDCEKNELKEKKDALQKENNKLRNDIIIAHQETMQINNKFIEIIKNITQSSQKTYNHFNISNSNQYNSKFIEKDSNIKSLTESYTIPNNEYIIKYFGVVTSS